MAGAPLAKRSSGAFELQGKRVVCFAWAAQSFRELVSSLSALPGCRQSDRDREPARRRLDLRGQVLCWELETQADRLLQRLDSQYVNLLLFDLRGLRAGARWARAKEELFQLLQRLDAVRDVETRYSLQRVLVLLPGDNEAAAEELILALGRVGVGAVLREGCGAAASGGSAAVTEQTPQSIFAERVLSTVRRILGAPRGAKRTLCAAGGGIAGVFFEIGTLKCLEDCTGGKLLNSFDMYFGISAGAVVTGILAAGYSIEELMAAIAGHAGGRIPPINMRLLRWGHLDLPGAKERLRQALGAGLRAARRLVPVGAPPSVDALLFESADLLIPPFRAAGFERMLRDVLSVPGATNDFRLLPRPLYIGVTDQDAREHLLFGDQDHDDVPISVAIQASMSLNPAFSATRIGDRYYEDGAVTRTSNFVEAIHRGAGLVVVVDPFVPYVSREPGFARRQGALYNVDQNIRTVSYTRFETTRYWVLRRYPDVASYTFLPANRLRRLLSTRPFDHRPYFEIWRGAYLSTLQRVRRLSHRLRGDLAAWGLTLDTTRAELVGQQLEATAQPSFADFFAERQIELPQPPLCLESSALAADGTVPLQAG